MYYIPHGVKGFVSSTVQAEYSCIVAQYAQKTKADSGKCRDMALF
jgi:hypothetical protein